MSDASESKMSSSAPRPDLPAVNALLTHLMLRGGSDLHLTVGSPPGIRILGRLIPTDFPVLTAEDTKRLIFSVLSDDQRKRFERDQELDFAHNIPGISRFRVNIFQQRNSMAAVFRTIPLSVPTLDELGLPKVCKFLAERPRGLVLVTGPTGSGKSTTLAAMINHINATQQVHIVTVEDPIEFVHSNQTAYINQREIGEDTDNFSTALRRVLRQDPDVIMLGELRDLETIAAAVTAAETGHLVFGTLHTTGAAESIERMVDVFPPHQQEQIRIQLAGALEGVLSQVLLRSADGMSRVLAMEVMLGTPAIANLIRTGKTHQITTVIQTSQALDMRTLDQDLKSLVQKQTVTYQEAVAKAKDPAEFAAMMGRSFG